MSFEFKSDKLTWLMGFNKKKAQFPEPFKSSALLDSSMLIRLPSKPETESAAKLGFTLAYMLKCIYGSDGEAIAPFIGVDADKKTLCVEYYSSAPEQLRLFAYNFETQSLYGATATLPACLTKAEGFAPYNFKEGTGTALYMTLLFGRICRPADATETIGTSYSISLVESLKAITSYMDRKIFVGIMDDIPANEVSNIAALTYKGFKDGIIHDGCEVVGPFGVYSRLTEEMARDYHCVPLNAYLGADVLPDAVDSKCPTAFSVADISTAKKSTVATPRRKTISAKEPEDMGKLRDELKLPIHELSDAEKEQVEANRLGLSYVVDDGLLTLARKTHRNWAALTAPRGVDLAPNILLEGDSGSGKTVGAKFFADVFGIPYTKMTMEPMMDSSTLIGAFYPYFEDMDGWECSDEVKDALEIIQEHLETKIAAAKTKLTPSDAVRSVRQLLGDENVRAKVRSAAGIPLAEEILFDPEGAWETLGETGDVPEADIITAMANERAETLFFNILNTVVNKAEANQVSYRFILSELMKAFENGWLLEIQEAANVLRPGVLTQLNSLMEKNGSIELPNGKRIRRHRDTIVVITTNKGYAGNMDLNESLRDRCVLSLAMDNPPPEVMASRAMAQVEGVDEDVALAAAQVIHDVDEVAKEHRIKGAFGMRSLIGWMMDLADGDTGVDAFMSRVINKMTTNEDDVALLIEPYRNSRFASRIKRTV